MGEEGMNTSRQIRILTVDDHPVLREGIAAVVAAEPDLLSCLRVFSSRLARNLVEVDGHANCKKA
jgi:DNA-binding NarL/FixJ family response regulator